MGGGEYNTLYIKILPITTNSDPGKKINIGCNIIISRLERLELHEFPRYNIFFTQGKTQKPKTRTYYVGHSVPVPDFSKPIRIRSVPAPKILKLIRTRTRTRTKFSKKIRTRHVYAPKNQFFSLPVLSTHPYLGTGA